MFKLGSYYSLYFWEIASKFSMRGLHRLNSFCWERATSLMFHNNTTAYQSKARLHFKKTIYSIESTLGCVVTKMALLIIMTAILTLIHILSAVPVHILILRRCLSLGKLSPNHTVYKCNCSELKSIQEIRGMSVVVNSCYCMLIRKEELYLTGFTVKMVAQQSWFCVVKL